MRRTNAVRGLGAATLALTLALTLAACGSDSEGSDPTPSATPSTSATAAATASAEDVAALADVKVEGEPGSKPTITLPSKPFSLGANVARMDVDGDGEEIAAGDVLKVHVTAVDGADGSELGTTYGDATQSWSTSSPFPEIDEVLVGSHLGSRIVFGLVDGENTAVYVMEAIDKMPTRAEGTAVPLVEGLPTVTLDEATGEPTITAAEGEAPTELVVQPLIEGDGAVIEDGQTVDVQYSGVLWDGTPFDSSWTNGSPFSFEVGAGNVIAGWDEGLVGQKVGSQVLLVVPPDKGYGDQESGSIPANSTLVFVVDILGAS